MRDFLKEIFTLKTVYIDKGRGKWAVKRRLHPVIRFTLSILLLTVCGIIYAKSGTVQLNNAEAITNKNNKQEEIITATLPMPEPVKAVLPPVQDVPVKTEPKKENKPVIIPLNNKNKVSKKTEILLPSAFDF